MAIIGAIIGDIVGSLWEFNRTEDIDWKHIDLFTEDNYFTDDTVLTMATKYALDNGIPFEIAYHIFGNTYPGAGYGGSFCHWLMNDDMKPYNSYGNGSAMRISPIIDFCKTKDNVIQIATCSAKCTHSHPEGIKGAVVTAVCGWMAKNGASKKEIKEYAIREYPEDLYKYSTALPLSIIRKDYIWNEYCQGSVPVAIRCFLESEDYESFLRNAIGLKGDADTLCAIGGCIAEEFYGTTGFDNKTILKKYLDERLYEQIYAGGQNGK